VDLRTILHRLKLDAEPDPNLLVGFETADDAGVYKLTDEIALIQTIDFITPLCDDPFIYGQIAAANSLSDVYAMGGRPINAMNVCCFPSEGVDPSVLADILRGGYDKIIESGATLLGGHTVKDQELKFGLSLTGLVHPDRVLRNSTCKPGDKLVITKLIGTGVIITGAKNDLLTADEFQPALENMQKLNKTACEVMLEVGVNACTDISGFGLAGHLCEMALGSKVRINMNLALVPIYPATVTMMEKGIRTGVTLSNQQSCAGCVHLERELPRIREMILYDPQTSGPLMISVSAAKADLLVQKLKENGVADAAIIGDVEESAVAGLFVRDSL
jgi:selenide,water dikinase